MSVDFSDIIGIDGVTSVTRRRPGALTTDRGVRSYGAATETVIEGVSVFTLSGEQLADYAEGERVPGGAELFTDVQGQWRISRPETGQDADRMLFNGSTYKAVAIEPWVSDGNYQARVVFLKEEEAGAGS